MPLPLETDRLRLRPWQPEDAHDAFALWGDPEVMTFDDVPETSIEQTRETIAHQQAEYSARGLGLWPVMEKASGVLIGCCGFHTGAHRAQLELVYQLRPPYWGKGFASEAAGACIEHAWRELGTREIVAFVRPGNVASSRLLLRLGFVPEGSLGGEDLYRLSHALNGAKGN